MKQKSKKSLIRFNYLYRDAGNYKKWSFVDFKNPEGLELDEIHSRLEKCFDMRCLFNAEQAGLPEIFLFNADDYSVNADDHCFHEYYSVEAVLDSREDLNMQSRSISQFVQDVENCSRIGWKAFDPQDIWYRTRSSK
jgi:hypothetical protein